MLADYFSSVFTREPQDEKPIRCCNTVDNCTINPDGYHPRVKNELANCISITLSIIFNTSLTTGKLPTDRKQANIPETHKKGNKTLPQNYRRVGLTSVVGKIMEEITRDTITVHMKENDILSNKQFGFIKAVLQFFNY